MRVRCLHGIEIALGLDARAGRQSVGLASVVLAVEGNRGHLDTFLLRLTNKIACPGLANSDTEDDELGGESLRENIVSVVFGLMWTGTHGEDGPHEQEGGADFHVLAVGNSEDNTEDREWQCGLDQDSGETGVRAESIVGKNTSELLTDSHELVDNEGGDNDVDGNRKRCPWNTEVDGSASEECCAWSRALVKTDDSHG